MHRNLAIAGLVCLTSVAASAVTISDSSFSNGLWSGLKVENRSTPSTTFSAAHSASFGGRTDVRLVTHFFGPADPVRSDIVTFHAFNGATYNPSLSGAVGSLSISFDVNSHLGGTSGGVAYSVAVQQGGTVFVASGVYASALAGTGWYSMNATGLTALSFSSTTLTSPDFTASGAPISLGLVLSNGSSLGVGTSSQTYLDNFSTTVTPVPEPANAAAVLGIAAIAAVSRRRARPERKLA